MLKGDIWTIQQSYPNSWIVIPTNGIVRKDGACVMGRGLARQAAQRYPEFPYEVGKYIRANGNIVGTDYNHNLLTFPVKHAWWQKADLTLIQESWKRLLAYQMIDCIVLVPHVGCGNGQLTWDTEVKPLLTPWPDNFLEVVQ